MSTPDMFDPDLVDQMQEQTAASQDDEPVECLGMTFPNDQARRAYFLEKLREKLKDPEFRKIEGFPMGEDEDILALSDPPYYTACPNPFIEEFIKRYGKPYDPKDNYSCEPYAADISEGKNDPIYNAHSYHTKVPHKAIMRYILHYTKPGDVILDGFCGTGMTGVASALCAEIGSERTPPIKSVSTGQRWPILIDLSPIATFISSNLLRPFERDIFIKNLNKIYYDCELELGYLYQTQHTGWKVRDRKLVEHKAYHHKDLRSGDIEFTLYSDVIRCPECSGQTNYYSVAVDEKNDSFHSEMYCPYCHASVPEAKWEPVFTTVLDPILNSTITQIQIKPVLINYSVGSKRYEKIPDEYDRKLIEKATELLHSQGLPAIKLIEGKETQRNAPIGISYLHQFFTAREQLFVANLLRRIQKLKNHDIRLMLLFALTASLPYTSRMRRFRADRKGGGPLSGTLYVSSLITPPNVLKTFKRNAITIANSLSPAIDPRRGHIVSTQSAGDLSNIPSNSIDYIFTDPPFGHNFDYSELNFFWEGILRIVTDQAPETIVSTTQHKQINEYRALMASCFKEFYRVLKPGHWITVEFSNTKASVWNSIQTALTEAGFVVANVSVLDKKQGSFKAVTTPTAVKQDLVISGYKIDDTLEERFSEEAPIEGVWEFMRMHLQYLPVVKQQDSELIPIPERDPRILFDQMVAHFVRIGRPVPLSSQEFQAGLSERFVERDGMIFLPEQVVAYDRRRLTTKQLKQFTIFVDNEASTIEWLRQQLIQKPMTYQDIHPLFIDKIRGWRKTEKSLELSELLEQNFLRYEGRDPVPSQIHNYLSTNFKELRNLDKDDPLLKVKAKDRWYMPNLDKAQDLEKLRERSLLKEFEEYKQFTGRRMKQFRLEAVRAGFKKAWQDKDYKTIIRIAEKIPEDVLQEDPKLLMWYDQAQTRQNEQSLF